MLTSTIEIIGLSELEALLDPEAVSRAYRAAAYDVGAKVKADASEDAPRDLGILAGGIDFDVWEESAEPVEWDAVVFSPEAYAAVMELGRRPAPETRMPPPSMLEGWASRHFDDWAEMTPSQRDSALYGLAMSIWIDGIDPRPFMGPALDVNADYAVEALDRYLGIEWEATQ